MNDLQTQFSIAYDTWQAASIVADAARKERASDRVQLSRLCDLEHDRMRAIGRSIKRDFAESRGWRESKRGFSITQLRDRVRGRDAGNLWHPEIDHPDYFEADGVPAGIVTHSYCDWNAIAIFAAGHDLQTKRVPFSWYSPLTTAVLLTRNR
jgi:hypothetical protein